jgi:hypothetical protein
MGRAVAEDRTAEGKVAREGLCAACVFARRIESARGSRFVLCERSRTDPTFPKYPRLPVIACAGYAPKSKPGDKPDR